MLSLCVVVCCCVVIVVVVVVVVVVECYCFYICVHICLFGFFVGAPGLRPPRNTSCVFNIFIKK